MILVIVVWHYEGSNLRFLEYESNVLITESLTCYFWIRTDLPTRAKYATIIFMSLYKSSMQAPWVIPSRSCHRSTDTTCAQCGNPWHKPVSLARTPNRLRRNAGSLINTSIGRVEWIENRVNREKRLEESCDIIFRVFVTVWMTQ